MKPVNNIRFSRLFQGLSSAYQQVNFNVEQNDSTKVSTEVWCVKKPPTEQKFSAHLEGRIGLGIYPLNEKSECWFGVIDVDDYKIDYQKITDKIHKNKLPLIPCRSKSGGMHLYLFCKQSSPARLVKEYLLRCAGILELSSNVEFRPESVKYEGGFGSGITLPYFNMAEPKSYAYGENGVLPFELFLELAESKRVEINELKNPPQFLEDDQDLMYQAPPCLQRLCQEGIPVGTRNNAMYNFGIYAKIRFGEKHAHNMLHEYNRKLLDKPLSDKEIDALGMSVNKKNYFYKCSQEPICSKCDKTLCRTRQFGIGNSLIDNNSHCQDISIDSLVKHDADEPFYIVTVNSKTIRPMTYKELLSSATFAAYAGEALDIYIRANKKRHEAMLAEAMKKMKKIPKIEEATEIGSFESMMEAFFEDTPSAETRREVLADRPFYENGYVFFRVDTLEKFLKYKDFKIEKNKIYYYLSILEGKDDVRIVLSIDNKSYKVIKLKREPPLHDEASMEIGY